MLRYENIQKRMIDLQADQVDQSVQADPALFSMTCLAVLNRLSISASKNM